MQAVQNDEPLLIRLFEKDDLEAMRTVWNEVVEDGVAFPQEEMLDADAALEFFSSQSATAVAVCGNRLLGLYILHPNNTGRCSHIANASYAVSFEARGRGIGRALVSDSLERAGSIGFRGLQFNAVVASNAGAIHLYEDLGFTRIGTIFGGFRMKDGTFQDTFIYFHEV
ncbi:GNAT family N-acetyltransferase [Raoultibacter phocaeensis]|uniref:GNAT family N-acetyltransferase n=1 Tax=Raoultibacter phocaeensis TaxID=2479841 RepID=UPI0011183F4D|nr:GNAT family N-acetyltransferase [Raoultibacter phocaeensis]